MLRFLIFVWGIALGFATAIFVLPIPGRTFFNKMSKLPVKLKDLIDNSIEIFVSLSKLGTGVYEDINLRLTEAIEEAKITMEGTNNG
jgi:hypothetical protein